MRERRLVTLSGPGGTGKTRLALQVAAELVGDFNDGVFWVPLAALTDSELVMTTIAQTLGAKNGLAAYIDEKHMLFLLDNLEQLLPAAPGLSHLLTCCPNLHLLVTSRALLRVAGEREYLVEPLPETDAVRLFVERAAQSEPENVVAEICSRLDGLPLAVELAAARTRIFSPTQLLKRLEKALPLLTLGLRDAPARQQTLRATIEWSYDLLAPEEQKLLARLAVFSGSFSVEAAEAICEAELETLEALVEQSLVRRWESGRLGMLETIAEFAFEQLEALGEAEERHHEHADHFLALAEEAERHLKEGQPDEWLHRLDAERTNLRRAIEWADRSQNDALRLRLALALWNFWFLRSHLDEGARRCDEALEIPGATSDQRLLLLGGAAVFACERGLFARAKSLLEERLALARKVSDKRRVVDSLRVLGTTHAELGDIERARELLEESVALAAKLPVEATLVRTLAIADLGCILLSERQYAAAIAMYEEALGLFREHSDPRGASVCLENIAMAELRSGHPDQATVRLCEALTLAHEIGNPPCIVNALVVLAAIAVGEHRARHAAIMLGAEDALCDAVGYSHQRLERELRDEAEAIARGELGDEEFESALVEGGALEPEAAVMYALGAAGPDA